MITDLKTPKSKRNVSMPDFLCEESKEHIGRLYGFLPTDRILHLSESFLAYQHGILGGINREQGRHERTL